MNLVHHILVFNIIGIIVILCKSEETSQCLTPKGEEGFCVLLRLCLPLKQAFNSGNETLEKYVEDSACKNGNFIVCCPNSSITINNVEKAKDKNKKDTEHANKELLPNKRYCGQQHTDDYFYDGNITSVDEFPWIVQVECFVPEQHGVDQYPGVLINNKYVLVNNQYGITNNLCTGKAVVTLGRHRRQESISCITTKFNQMDCTAPEQKIVATEYKGFLDMSFALLRLERGVVYSDFIRPICLAFEEKEVPKVDNTVTSSGWATTEVYIGQAYIKQRIHYEVISYEECEEQAKQEPLLKASYLCAKRITEQDYLRCRGDRGSPMMYKYKHRWYIAGMLADPQCTYTGNPVNINGKPVVTNETPVIMNIIDESVLEWILNTIRA